MQESDNAAVQALVKEMMTHHMKSGFCIETLVVTRTKTNEREISVYSQDKITYCGDKLGLTYEIDIFPPDGGFDPRHSICIKLTDKQGVSTFVWGWKHPNEHGVIIKTTPEYEVELHFKGNT